MFVSIENLNRQLEGIQAIVDRCIQEKWVRVVEKSGVRYLSRSDVYKVRFIFHLHNTGTPWEDIPRYLTPGHLYSVETCSDG